jgi:hypothetical protein
MYTLNSMPQGAKYATGKGSAFKTLTILGGSPEKDVDLNLGWANIHITAKSGQLDIDYRPNEKANTGKREETIGMGEGQIPYAGAEEDRLKAGLTREEKMMLAQNPELTAEDFYEPQEPQFEYNREEIGERPENIPDHVSQKMPQQYSENYVPDGLQKVELPQYRYGKIKVYLVNDDWIRTTYADESIGDRLGNDFTGGGHALVYWKLIPKNEIWIARSLKGLDRKGYILHEMTERRTMVNGEDYSDAHNDYANPPEIVARTNPRLVDQLIQDEMAKYEKPAQKVRRRNETKEEPKTVAEIEKEYEDKYNIPREPKNLELNDDEIAPKYYLGRRINPKVEANAI